MMINSTISIVMINFNNEKYIKECIESVVNQSQKPNEFIICDDGSSDNSINIIKEYAQRHDYIKLYENSHRLGPAANRHKAILKSTSVFFANLDSDDYLNKDYILNIFNKLQKNPNSIIISNFNVCDDDGLEIDSINTAKFCKLTYNKKIQTLVSRSKICPGNQFALSKDIYLKIKGIDIRLRMYEDLDLFFNVLLSRIEFCHSGIIGHTYRKSNNGISSNTSKIKHFYYLVKILWKNYRKSQLNNHFILGLFQLIITKVPIYILGRSNKHGFN